MDDIEALEKRVNELEDERDTLQDEVSALEETRDDLTRERDELLEKIATATDSARTTLSDLEAR